MAEAADALKVDDWVLISKPNHHRAGDIGKVAVVCIDDRGMLICCGGDHVWVGVNEVKKVNMKIHRGFCTVCNIKLDPGQVHTHQRGVHTPFVGG